MKDYDKKEVHTCDIIASSGSMKVSANATLAVLSIPNTTSTLCNHVQASKASALHGKSKKAKPRFNPSFFMSSTSVKSSNLSTPYFASCFSTEIKGQKPNILNSHNLIAKWKVWLQRHKGKKNIDYLQHPLSMSCICYQQKECHYLDLEPPHIASH